MYGAEELQRSLAEKHGEAFDWINKNYKHLVVGSLMAHHKKKIASNRH